jgi:hypothetical protein
VGESVVKPTTATAEPQHIAACGRCDTYGQAIWPICVFKAVSRTPEARIFKTGTYWPRGETADRYKPELRHIQIVINIGVYLKAADVGGSMTIHAFGAYFGQAATWYASLRTCSTMFSYSHSTIIFVTTRPVDSYIVVSDFGICRGNRMIGTTNVKRVTYATYNR